MSSTRLLFGGGNDQDNYFIGTNLENYGGNYTKLDLRWHTGIRMGAQATYGGTRIFNNEDLSTLFFSRQRRRQYKGGVWQSVGVGGNEVWHAGNDGSGSTLDADTVDGVQLSGLLQRTFEDSNRNLIIQNPSSSNGAGIEFRRNDGNFQGQLYFDNGTTAGFPIPAGVVDLRKQSTEI